MRAHSETVLRSFYGFHLEAGTGPIMNPFPLPAAAGRAANAHHNPMEPYRDQRPASTARGAQAGAPQRPG